MPGFNLDDVKRVPILDVARHLGISPAQRKMIRCPFPDHEDKSPSFSFFVSTNSCWCFGCGRGGSVIDLVAISQTLTLSDAIAWLHQTYRLDVKRQNIRQLLIPKSKVSSSTSKNLGEVFEPNSQIYDALLRICPVTQAASDYLHSRGFTSKTIKHFRIGSLENAHAVAAHLITKFGPNAVYKAGLLSRDRNDANLVLPTRSIIFPFSAGQAITYLQSRVLTPGEGPRWIGLRGIVRPIYNQDVIRQSPTIYICEGATDVLAAHELKMCAIGLLGASSTLSQEVVDSLRGKMVLIIPDNDDAGSKMAKNLTAVLRAAGIQNVTKRLSKGKDLNEYLLHSRPRL